MLHFRTLDLKYKKNNNNNSTSYSYVQQNIDEHTYADSKSKESQLVIVFHTRRSLVLVHDGNFDSLDFGYMRGFLDDAACGACRRSTIFRLGQVGQRHGGVDLSPVRLVFSTPPFLHHDAAVETQGYGVKHQL